MNVAKRTPATWREVKDLNDCKRLIDIGILFGRGDQKVLRNTVDYEGQKEVLRHIAIRFAERMDERLAQEILVESLLWMLRKSYDTDLISTFIAELLLHPCYLEASMRLVELLLTMEVIVERHGELLVGAVSLICELGLLVREIFQTYPEKLVGAEKILAHVSTYLLSISNVNSFSVRLSLINYFGVTETPDKKSGFNRIMNRFGFTVMEYLFRSLFVKKTEGVALQFIRDNIPYVLEGDVGCQRILNETLRTYMLKHPERFVLFIRDFASNISNLEGPRFLVAKETFLRHMGQLLNAASEVNHNKLAVELTRAILMIEPIAFREQLLSTIANEKGAVRKAIREAVLYTIDTNGQGEDLSIIRAARRGRKPSFTQTDEMNTLQQVAMLSHVQQMKAS